jgi:tetratricopeptide (TPR) repeat protein
VPRFSVPTEYPGVFTWDALDPENPRTHENLALLALRGGRWQEARAAARRALELNDSLPQAWNDLGAALYQLGDRSAALDACYLALSLDPDDIALHLGLVELYEERGWTVLATEKLDLLDRLVALDDGAGADRVAAARAARG